MIGCLVLGWVLKGDGFCLFAPGAVDKVRGLASREVVRNADAALLESPSPMARVHTEGTLPHKGIRDESIRAERDWGRMLDLAFAYRLTGERKYLDGEARFLGAWMGVYQASLNPIDETPLDQVLIAFDLTRGDLPADLRERTLGFCRGMAEGYLGFVEGHAGPKNAEDWQSHRIKLATLAAFALGDEGLIRRARRAFEVQVGMNIRADGSVEDFYKRDALHYVTYDLDPLEIAALAGKAHGEDWFHFKSASGSSLASAVDWLLPYASGEKTHEEFVHSSVPFDAARNRAGEKGYSGIWEPKGALRVLALAAALDPGYGKAFAGLAAKGGSAPFWVRFFVGNRSL